MDNDTISNLIGASPAFKRTLILIERFANLDVTVLISGETGTGKELTARALHNLGSRHNQPFIAINCSAIPEHLVESEFFGHVRGAFTDASQTRIGLIEAASGGTIFLDEIEAMSLRTQAVLLRFLQEKTYRPVGANTERTCNARIIVASNLDLFEMSKSGLFRVDLLHRITPLKLNIPPLRHRTGDISLLAQIFVERLNLKFPNESKVLHADSLKTLESYEWPGNIRELENLIFSEFLMAEGEIIRIQPIEQSLISLDNTSHHQPSVNNVIPFPHVIEMEEYMGSYQRRRGDNYEHFELPNFFKNKELATYEAFKRIREKLVSELEYNYLNELLTMCQGNLSLASRLSGRDRSDLCKLCKKYGLQRYSVELT